MAVMINGANRAPRVAVAGLVIPECYQTQCPLPPIADIRDRCETCQVPVPWTEFFRIQPARLRDAGAVPSLAVLSGLLAASAFFRFGIELRF